MSRRAQPHERLVLLDIDGTILHGGKLWRECFEESFRACCAAWGVRLAAPRPPEPGVPTSWLDLPRVAFSGKTDGQICRELLEGVGHWPAGVAQGADPAADARIGAILRGYLDRAAARAPGRRHEIRVLPGVRELVAALGGRDEVRLGLLTGNVREGAALKLGSIGLAGPFVTGVYGDDHWDRYQLPALAVERAARELGIHFAGKQIVIVGDTIHDVGCGQAVGARAIGVGTGHAEARARVVAAWRGEAPGDPRPDYFFEDLADLEAVLQAILA